MPLREIIYLDRPRVESYISQLAGSLTVEESASSSETTKGAGTAGVDLKVIKVEGVLGTDLGTVHTTTAVPAHAVLARLEGLLEQHDLVVDAAALTVLPGQIARLKGDATFESWGMLAALADSVQGVANLGVKIAGVKRSDVQHQADAFAKRIRRNELDGEAQAALGKMKPILALLSVVEDEYLVDIKNVVKLFFQDQNHIRITSRGKTFVGLMRRENLVGSTMEEILFDYGAKPRASFDALFYVAEFGRNEATSVAEDLGKRFTALVGRAPSLGLVQQAIREVGSLILDLAEEIRRPIGPDAAFVVPLALYREIRTGTTSNAGR